MPGLVYRDWSRKGTATQGDLARGKRLSWRLPGFCMPRQRPSGNCRVAFRYWAESASVARYGFSVANDDVLAAVHGFVTKFFCRVSHTEGVGASSACFAGGTFFIFPIVFFQKNN